jgi:hypothetical protein
MEELKISQLKLDAPLARPIFHASGEMLLGTTEVPAAQRVFSSAIVKALLNCISLFPIGSWVELSDGSLARVVAANRQNYTRPTVSVIFRGGERLGDPERTNLSEATELNILRPVPEPAEVRDFMEGF